MELEAALSDKISYKILYRGTMKATFVHKDGRFPLSSLALTEIVFEIDSQFIFLEKENLEGKLELADGKSLEFEGKVVSVFNDLVTVALKEELDQETMHKEQVFLNSKKQLHTA